MEKVQAYAAWMNRRTKRYFLAWELLQACGLRGGIKNGKSYNQLELSERLGFFPQVEQNREGFSDLVI